MKKVLNITVMILLVLALAACQNQPDTKPDANGTPDNTTVEHTAAPESSQKQETETENAAYEFEFEDLDGNVHKLSDYEGKPIYLRVWTSWCGVCTSSLESLDTLTAQSKDFTVLSVVMPSMDGEMSREDFTKWYNEFGYENLVVLFDDAGQLVRDFGINAYPTQIMFDAQGRVVYGAIGLMSEDMINDTMQKITDQT